MKIELEINENDLILDWEDNASLKVTQPSRVLIEIEANKEGLISLGKHLIRLAYMESSTMDIHYFTEINTDKGYFYGDLDEGSFELSIAKIEKAGRKIK